MYMNHYWKIYEGTLELCFTKLHINTPTKEYKFHRYLYLINKILQMETTHYNKVKG